MRLVALQDARGRAALRAGHQEAAQAPGRAEEGQGATLLPAEQRVWPHLAQGVPGLSGTHWVPPPPSQDPPAFQRHARLEGGVFRRHATHRSRFLGSRPLLGRVRTPPRRCHFGQLVELYQLYEVVERARLHWAVRHRRRDFPYDIEQVHF